MRTQNNTVQKVVKAETRGCLLTNAAESVSTGKAVCAGVAGLRLVNVRPRGWVQVATGEVEVDEEDAVALGATTDGKVARLDVAVHQAVPVQRFEAANLQTKFKKKLKLKNQVFNHFLLPFDQQG